MPSASTASSPAHWLSLWRVPGVGPAAFKALVDRYGSPGAALSASRAELARAGLSEASIERLKTPDQAGVERDLAWLDEPGHHLVLDSDPAYPARLGATPQAPPLLFVNGDPSILSDPQVAIVGSRHPTPGGVETAHALAEALAGVGLAITSGLALGIDAASHEGALATDGTTIAVAATGPDRVYPARHRQLAHRITERGAIVSEFPTGVAPRAEHFPRRNRIIAGLSLGTLVVEANRRSGSLITARWALEAGREVMAVPGSIHNPLAKGCHHLIRQGAKLVESVDDVLTELADVIELDTASPGAPERKSAAFGEMDSEYRRLLECLGHDPAPIDVLVERSGLTADTVSSMLLILELNGQVAAGNDGRYMRMMTSNQGDNGCER